MFRSAVYRRNTSVLEGITIIKYLKHTHYYWEVFFTFIYSKKVVPYST